ncbi:MAG: hypothetical protein JXA11_03615 [Phycisphaerae bacterium]|nr:hypothetical protein [Phycisphaerae bacterium]
MGVGPLDRLITRLASMDREGLIRLLLNMRCTFPMDFTEEFLHTISEERLRHIVLAAFAHQHKACA